MSGKDAEQQASPGPLSDVSQHEKTEHELELLATLRCVSRVLLPILFVNGALGHFEKGNLAFAALQLNRELGFSAIEYGVGSGLYFIGLGVGILPSTFLTLRIGARAWMGSMVIAQGIIAAAHAGISGRTSFYVLRILLGLAEAGGGSSQGHLLAQFYPKHKRAQPFTITMLSLFAAGMMAAPLATGLLSLDGRCGLRGWQWLFLIEALPHVLIGGIIWVWLPSHPKDAWMLTPRQRELLLLEVHGSPEEADAACQPPRWSQLLALVWEAVRRPMLWFFTLTSLLFGLAVFSFFPWLVVIIQNVLDGTALRGSSVRAHGGGHGSLPVKAILLSAIPSVLASVAAVLVAWHSERVRERTLHVAVPWMLGGVLLCLFSPLNSSSAVAGFVGLVLAKVATGSCSGVKSAMLVGVLDTKHAGIGLALHHAVISIGGGFAGPVLVGALVESSGSFAKAMTTNGLLLMAGAALLFGLAAHERGLLHRASGTLGCRRGARRSSSSSGSQGSEEWPLARQGSTAAHLDLVVELGPPLPRRTKAVSEP